MHPTLAVTPEGVALGVIDAWMWARGPKDQPQVKESTRWMEGYKIVADWAETPDTRMPEALAAVFPATTLANLHRPPDPQQPRLRELKGSQGPGGGDQADLHGSQRRSGTGRT